MVLKSKISLTLKGNITSSAEQRVYVMVYSVHCPLEMILTSPGSVLIDCLFAAV